ncbi:hypothetical protein L209DRAFT_345374 [Thermothelomyces heterothallicus CBS 203.75]
MNPHIVRKTQLENQRAFYRCHAPWRRPSHSLTRPCRFVILQVIVVLQLTSKTSHESETNDNVPRYPPIDLAAEVDPLFVRCESGRQDPRRYRSRRPIITPRCAF